jgi:hypothetical protein
MTTSFLFCRRGSALTSERLSLQNHQLSMDSMISSQLAIGRTQHGIAME